MVRKTLPNDGYTLNSGPPYYLVPVRQEGDTVYLWYSICSRHQSHAPECDLCARGTWYEAKFVETEE